MESEQINTIRKPQLNAMEETEWKTKREEGRTNTVGIGRMKEGIVKVRKENKEEMFS